MRTFLKWTGSKRLQADFIIDKFPREIDTYYEPFLGSGSIMMRLLETEIPVNNIVASDICEPLIGLWKEVQVNPQSIIDTYRSLHKEFVKDRKTIFNEVRKTFNEDKTNYGHFLFLTRTCINGLIRFNSKGNFNSACHLMRDGILPDTLEKIIWDTHEKIQKVAFKVQSYDKNKPTKDDLIYLDPPYFYTTKNMYYGGIDLSKFFDYVNNLPCKWLLSFDGLVEDKKKVCDIPIQYKKLYYSDCALSTFRKVQNNELIKIKDSLYTNYEEEERKNEGVCMWFQGFYEL